MDEDLEQLRSFARFNGAVECLLEPLLKKRAIAPMPCEHRRKFEIAREARRTNFEAIGADDPYGEELLRQPEGYCDCGPFNRRNEF